MSTTSFVAEYSTRRLSFTDCYDGAFLDVTFENTHPTRDSRENFRMTQSEEIELLEFLKAREIVRLMPEALAMNKRYDEHAEALEMNAQIDYHIRQAARYLEYARDELNVRRQHMRAACELKTGRIQA